MISLLILKLHRICGFWKKCNYFSGGPHVLGSKKNTLFSIAGNFIFHLDISQIDKYQIFGKLYQTVDLSTIWKLNFSECLYSAIYKKIYLQWTRSLVKRYQRVNLTQYCHDKRKETTSWLLWYRKTLVCPLITKLRLYRIQRRENTAAPTFTNALHKRRL